jgi:hypothetical protein
MHKIKGIVASVLMAAGLGLAAAPMAGAATVGHHGHHHAQVFRPHLTGGNYQFEEANGNYYVGSFDLNAGSQVVESSSARNFTFTVVTTYSGDNAGYLQFSNGNFLAANTVCDGATIKSSSSSFGTVWAPKFTGTTHTYDLVNRGCDQNAGSTDTVYMAGRNNASQFTFCNSAGGGCNGGYYHKMIEF